MEEVVLSITLIDKRGNEVAPLARSQSKDTNKVQSPKNVAHKKS